MLFFLSLLCRAGAIVLGRPDGVSGLESTFYSISLKSAAIKGACDRGARHAEQLQLWSSCCEVGVGLPPRSVSKSLLLLEITARR